MFARVGLTAAVVALVAAGWMASLVYQRYEHKKYLYDSGYPRELYDWQDRLKKVALTAALDLERFNWLSSDSVEELSLLATNSSNSLAGLASLSRCRKLTKLTLDLSFSQVSDLKPLEQLKGLQQLTLNLSEIQVSDLKLLEQLKGLQQLTLDLRDSQVSDLKPLEQLDELTSLDITLNGTSKEKNLEALLGKFLKMKSFSIAGATTEQRRSLRKIPASLVELKF